MTDQAERQARRADAQRVFDALAVAYLGRPGVSQGPMFGSLGLRAGGRFFAFVGADGQLVVKLPAGEAAELVASGRARPVYA
ncbi:MAG: hypothetical protein ACRDGL_04290, partial [Candidatus Limnocylindrales bacterium]